MNYLLTLIDKSHTTWVKTHIFESDLLVTIFCMLIFPISTTFVGSIGASSLIPAEQIKAEDEANEPPTTDISPYVQLYHRKGNSCKINRKIRFS